MVAFLFALAPSVASIDNSLFARTGLGSCTPSSGYCYADGSANYIDRSNLVYDATSGTIYSSLFTMYSFILL